MFKKEKKRKKKFDAAFETHNEELLDLATFEVLLASPSQPDSVCTCTLASCYNTFIQCIKLHYTQRSPRVIL